MIVRCRSCGHSIKYDIALQRMFCEYCGNSYRPEELEDDEECFEAVTYTCQSCGAQLITVDNTEATAFCSYCGSPSVLTGRLNAVKKPDLILPFQITREQCREIYLKKAKETYLVPKYLKMDEHIDSFRAIYMPYWSYSVNAVGEVQKVVKTRTEVEDTAIVTITNTTTSYVPVEVNEKIGTWTHDASKAFADDISEAIGFEREVESNAVPFHSAYLSGFYADMAEEVARGHKERAALKAKARVEEMLAGRNGSFIGEMEVSEHKLIYMPVWFMSVKHNGNITYAAINGYNGKIVADFPVSKKGFLQSAAVLSVVFSIMFALFTLRPEPAALISALIMLLGMVVCVADREKYTDLAKETGVLPKRSVWLHIMTGMSIVFGIAFAFSRRNVLIYLGAVLFAVALIAECFYTFLIHQNLAEKRPPQFDRKGDEKNE